MKLSTIDLTASLKSHIDTMWVFESEYGIPQSDTGLIVPNGKAKIVFLGKNDLHTKYPGGEIHCKEGEIWFVGPWNVSAILSSPQKKTMSIIAEVKLTSMYRFSSKPLHTLANKLCRLADIVGSSGQQLEEQMQHELSIDEKIIFFQKFLEQQLQQTKEKNIIVDKAIDILAHSRGAITVHQLSAQIGYSARYLSALFQNYIGFSPKTIAKILRFQEFYKLFIAGESVTVLRDFIYTYYYDQAHFIKEYKEFTGYSPQKLIDMRNDFGKIFYKLSSFSDHQ